MSTSKEELQARLASVEITEKAIEAKIHSLKNDFQKQLEALETSRQLFDAELQTLGKNAMNSLIKTTAALLLMTIALHVLSSCVSNNYTGFYSQHSNAEYIANETDMPIMMEDRDGQLLYQLLTKEDFIIIGSSDFYGLWQPRVYAIDCAKKNGASVIVLSYEEGETEEKQIKFKGTTAHTHTGYYDGINFNSTTYISEPVVIDYTETYYTQRAYYLAKRRYINTFGVYFELPQLIPGKIDNTVKVSLVKSGSLAEQQGIKAGDIVTQINGRAVESFSDISPYMCNQKEILSMEVEHE